jgi:catechol 2,3-dioxygenase-like lactoylglutathione lyase family enzyme
MRIGVTEIAVDDQERARDFYTRVLGLRVKADAPYGDGTRARDPGDLVRHPLDAVFEDGCGNLLNLHESGGLSAVEA